MYSNLTEDLPISSNIAEGKPFESDLFAKFESLLREHPTYGVLDIGANLGQYSLYAALAGHQTIAVEAYKPTLDKLHHSIVRNNLTSKITLIHNAIADTYQNITLLTDPENKGRSRIPDNTVRQINLIPTSMQVPTILMEDLADLVTFDEAIMKMDIENSEAKAMKHAEHLLNKVIVPNMRSFSV